MINEQTKTEVLQQVKKDQCLGGYSAFRGERAGAMKIAFALMKIEDMDFGPAIKQAWVDVKKQRALSCNLSDSGLLIKK